MLGIRGSSFLDLVANFQFDADPDPGLNQALKPGFSQDLDPQNIAGPNPTDT